MILEELSWMLIGVVVFLCGMISVLLVILIIKPIKNKPRKFKREDYNFEEDLK